MRFNFNCRQCGESVVKYRTPSQLRIGGEPKYCSQQCNGAARRGTGSGPRPNHRFTCETCGRRCAVYRSPSAQPPRFCSLECLGVAQRGEGNPAYTGGRVFNAGGYVWQLAPAHPAADCRGYVYEHRLVMEEQIGRLLQVGEVVHHINHAPDDNRLENLQLFASHSEHMRFHRREERQR